MGATLPTLTRYLTRHADHLSEAFGQLYAANTMGAIVGTIVAGFILIELLGLTGTLLVGAAGSGGGRHHIDHARSPDGRRRSALYPRRCSPRSSRPTPSRSKGPNSIRLRSGSASWWPPCRA